MQLKRVLLAHFLVLSTTLYSQDPHFSQFFAAPIYLNPALTGQSGMGSMGINSRQQWPSLTSSLRSTSLYLDHYFPNQKSGLGFLFNYHEESLLGLNAYDIGTAYSYNLEINGEYNFRVGTLLSLHNRNANFNNLTFGDQLDIATGQINPVSIEKNLLESGRAYLSLSLGGILYRKNRKRRSKDKANNHGDWWLGASMYHLNEPNQSIDAGEDRVSPRFSLQGGWVFLSFNGPNDRRTYEPDFLERSLTLVANWKRQQPFSQMDLGIQGYFEPFLLGLNYRGIPIKKLESTRNHASLIAMVGVDVSLQLTVGISHDFPVSRLSGATGGSNEISLTWHFSAFKTKKKRVKTERICGKR